ncbi:retrovirus-related pol polyprotein from transposon TNT 1-94 [Tanacetum coccineum]
MIARGAPNLAKRDFRNLQTTRASLVGSAFASVIDYVNDVNVHSKSKSKRNKMRKVWKPTGLPPLKKCLLRKPLITPVIAQSQALKVKQQKPKASRSVGSSSKAKIVESKTSNTKEAKQFWDPLFLMFHLLLLSIAGCPNFYVIGNDSYCLRKMGYGDYQCGKVTNLGSWYEVLLAKHGLVRGLSKLKYQKDHLCSVCALGKIKKHSHKPKAKDFIQEKLYLLHMDLCRPMRIQSINGRKYILVIVDDYSRFTWVKFLPSKDEVPEFVIKFFIMIEVRLNATIPNIRTDNGTEFVNQTLKAYYEEDSCKTFLLQLFPAVIAPDPAVSTGTPSSTIIDQNASSTSTSQTNQETSSPVIPLGVEEADHDIEVPHIDNNPYVDFPIPEPISE